MPNIESRLKIKYGAIMIDPPWPFRVWSKDTGHGRSAESHYPTMSIVDLMMMPIDNVMADDCAVFMWVTWPTLPDALALGKAWGLEYKTCAFNWLKRTTTGKAWHMGMGYWSRANSEPCLLFTQGNPKRIDKGVPQLIYTNETQMELFPPIVERVGAHSVKPEEAYRRVERLVSGPYLDVFARRGRLGWDVMGNEIDGQDITELLNNRIST